MPIASKLVYFQRRPSPAPPDDPGPEPPDPWRRPCRDHRRRRSSLSSHHKLPMQVLLKSAASFFAYLLQRSAFIAEAEDGTVIEPTHLERVLPQLLLDF
ncbi:protein MHF2 homolog isoform X1 [Miscanthus floridulus]|uniref:protein MHF2 homolog isoform X1 n=1 Tax=Miscanthus floridulus TaxID=154761 RepID=UPI003457BABC